jgi:ketosteroid isomerase-like protein
MPMGQLAPAPEGSVEARREALTQIAGDDLVTTMISQGAMLTAEFHGVDGFFEAWEDWLAPFERYHLELAGLHEAAGDRLLVETRQRVTPRGTDVEMENEAAGLLTFAEGRLVRVEFHLDPAAARRAAGLEAES